MLIISRDKNNAWEVWGTWGSGPWARARRARWVRRPWRHVFLYLVG